MRRLIPANVSIPLLRPVTAITPSAMRMIASILACTAPEMGCVRQCNKPRATRASGCPSPKANRPATSRKSRPALRPPGRNKDQSRDRHLRRPRRQRRDARLLQLQRQAKRQVGVDAEGQQVAPRRRQGGRVSTNVSRADAELTSRSDPQASTVLRPCRCDTVCSGTASP